MYCYSGSNDEFIKNHIIGNFEYIQLHGSETNERVKKIKSMGIKVIKTVKIKDIADIKHHKQYKNADIILFDTLVWKNQLNFKILYQICLRGTDA